ncbi:hypothetical protein BBK14_25870 [Parafrankia soli]|uniref:Uncharacterized protein n=1 Tax=Parafrankia soli TaxID=2599596 RepID=A0A1S1PLG4_9ACTN|nr:hypothetical protein [Parafrankia soli]OHV22196.1 hypothetical protein BBK14_25870 [Parafrankia soli]
MGRAIVFNGDRTWEERDLPVPDSQPGGAVLRVEATGLCHGDKDEPVNGLDSNSILFRGITIGPGAGLDAARAVALINDGQVPTTALAGETFPLDRFEDAFALLDRRVPGRDAVRVSLHVS